MENFKFKKQYGQNFLKDKNLLEAICLDAGITKDDEVLEIGVGFGALTWFLCKHAKKVVCYEIDTSLKEKIADTLSDYNNYEINFKDILSVDNKEISSKFSKPFKIVANLPYYITTPIIFKFLESDLDIKSLTIMVQSEVGERICSKHNTKDYGILSVMVQSRSDAKVVRKVNRNLFYPVPNVDSCIVNINIDKHKFKINNFIKFKHFIQSAFSMRRKTLVNNLKSAGFNMDCIIKVLENLNLNSSVRSESLSVENLVKLYKALVDDRA